MSELMAKPQGIGGWLILLTISLFGSSLISIFYIIWYIQGDNIVSMLAYTLVLCLTIYCLILVFKKKKEFKKWILILLGANIVIATVLGLMNNYYQGIPKAIVWFFIWGAYVSNSKRVKNTFVK